MNSKKQRTVSLIVCFLFLFVTFASLFYIAKEADHSCTGRDCPVCAGIHQVEQNLKNIGSGLTAGSTVKLIPVFIVVLAGVQFVPVSCMSLVSQKVRLND